MSWIAVGISAASFLSGAARGGSQAKSERKQASIQSNYLTQQLAELDKSEAQLNPVYESKQKVAEEQYREGIAGLSAETGQSKEDLQQQFQSMVQKSGMATSGSANQKSSKEVRVD